LSDAKFIKELDLKQDVGLTAVWDTYLALGKQSNANGAF